MSRRGAPDGGDGIWIPSAADAVGPRELPPGPRQFVNRTVERAELKVLGEPNKGRSRPLLVALSGLGGIGKTALVLNVAGFVQRLYPHGTLYVDLALHRQRGKVDPGQVLASLLRSLGLHDDDVPAQLDERHRRYMSLTAGKRILVVVDNVVLPSEAELLLPSSADSAVVVTSHHRLPELDGDVMLPLATLSDDDSQAMLAEFTNEARLSDDPAATRKLLAACGGIPIALRVVGAYLRKHPSRSLAQVAARLHGEFQHDRTRDGHGSVFDTVAKTAYEDLSKSAALVYRLLAVHPGASFDPSDVGALTDIDPVDAEDQLDELAQANLVVEDDGTYRFASLVAGHASTCCDRDEPRESQEGALLRLVTARLETAQDADRGMGDRLRFAEPRADGHAFSSRLEALNWLDRERGTLVALQRAGASLNRPDLVWRFAEALWPMFMARRGQADWHESSVLGLEAAIAVGNRFAEARMRCQLGRCHLEYGNAAEAEAEIRTAITILEGGTHHQALASAWEFLGRVFARGSRHQEATSAYETALTILNRMQEPDRRAIALLQHFIGQTQSALGEQHQAVGWLEEADRGFVACGDSLSRGKVAADLGRIQHRLGDVPGSVQRFSTAVDILTDVGATAYLAEANSGLGTVLAESGDLGGARDQFERAHRIFQQIGSPRADEIEAHLRSLHSSGNGDLEGEATEVD